MKSPRSYFAIQEKINAAIEATTPVSASRGGQILDFDFREPAGQADASFCHNDAPSCHNDASFCHNDAPSRRIGATCENVEQDEFTAPSSSWGNAAKPQENDMPETSNDVYINNNKNNNDNYFSYSSNDSNKGGELSGENGDCGPGDIGGWSAEVRYVARFIADSSPKHIDGVFLDKTMAAIRDVMDSGRRGR